MPETFPAGTPMGWTEIAIPLLGYGVSLTLSLLLAVLVWRSPGRRARATFALAAGLWSLGGLIRSLLLVVDDGTHAALLGAFSCLSFMGGAIWPVGLSALWAGSVQLTVSEKVLQRRLVMGATVNAVALIIALIGTQFAAGDPQAITFVRMLVGYNVLAFMLAALWFMRRHQRSVPERVGIALMLTGPAISVATHWVTAAALLPSDWDALTVLIGKQSVALSIVGGVFFLGRFRASDRMAKMSLRLLIGTVVIALVAAICISPLFEVAARTSLPSLTRFAIVCTGMVLVVTLLRRLWALSDQWVSARVFGDVDPIAALRNLRDELSRSDAVSSVIASAEHFVSEVLRLDGRVMACAATPAGVAQDAVPIHVGNTTPYVLTIDHRAHSRSLVSSEIEVLSTAADVVGRRLEALEREHERLERSQREAGLLHQLVEAELRALRAQVNPHFLFNSLNTIAALVHDRPDTAEAMTLSLARIFRYALSQATQQYSSLAQELQFLKAYLDIEQIRFGERLRVEYAVLEAVRDSSIPSLILQPLVENAIKHGLAPKVGDCRLLIAGARDGEQLVLSVEDNGVGVGAATPETSTGFGLCNVRERLRVLYGERARLRFESTPQHGSRATLYLPLPAA